MSEWKEYKLGEIITTNAKSIGKNYPFSRISYLDTGSITCNKIDTLQEFNISEAPSRAKRLVSEDDIVYSAVRPNQLHYGYIKNPQMNLVVSTGFVTITCNQQEINPKYLYYNLTQSQTIEYLHSIAEASTSAYPSLKPSDIEALDILLPPLLEQERIAGILSSLDDKIDLLGKQNATLEAMAETLFRQYFIENPKEEWKDGVIADIIDFNPTRKLSKDTIAPFLEMSNLSTTTYAPKGWYDRAFSSGTKFKNGDTLLARITPCLENGKTAYVDFLEDEQVAWGSTEYIVMCPKGELHPFFAYIVAKYQDFRDYAESCMSGSSGRQRVDIDNLKGYEIKIPDSETIKQFNVCVESIVGKMNCNNNQIRSLTKLRDNLLPKLMNNEVKIRSYD